MTLEEALSRPTIPVPVAGELFFGISRDAAYKAARRGDFPTMKVGGKVVALVAPIAAMLGLRATAGNHDKEMPVSAGE